MKRRGFLGSVFGAAIVGPKVAADAAHDIMSSGATAPVVYPSSSRSLAAAVLNEAPNEDWWLQDELRQQAYQAMLQKLMPDFYREELKAEVRRPNNFMDLDIEAHRSWSMAAKVTAQRDRDFQRRLEQRTTWHKHRIAEHLLRKANGV